MNDDELVARAKTGDTHAWRELYRAHAGRLVVWLGTRPSADAAISAEDLAAEAWLTAAQKIHDFSGTSSEFAGWIFGIARNLAANSRRRSLRRVTQPSADLPEGEHADGPEPALVARDWVAHALRGLPPRERDVVACIDVVGLDVESTSRALGISPVAVRVARHRGLRRLREAQGKEQGQESGRGPSQGQPSTASSRSR
ncbi:RNA polymerase sigma factor [Nocardioides ungokensis]|uniref:RNA polymerase sigma factor n=1 Tax=Nocardioides ungokensis TaxID=1643322 RepID=UPI0015DD5F60|nr:sigma-70 family RNA polymerase sigma factor [Nocardioides ungokensis]